jgi:hypothetical protein
MKRLVSILAVIAMLIACIFAGVNASAEANDPTPTCTVQVSNVICVLAGVTILNQPINVPTVHVTGPTVTVTIPPIRTTQTVTVPGPTHTVTAPGSTQTITASPVVTTETVTATNGPSALPTATVTANGLSSATTTVTATPRQDPSPSGTVDPDSGVLSNIPPTVVKTGVGLGIIALLALLILLGMYGGYYIGYRDSDKADAKLL